jgi:APA family basic amino acid/polyamine antiporter
MSEPSGAGASVRARVGWFTATCVLISNIIGGAIFTTTGFLARDLGDPILILSLWLVGAFLAFAGALSFSELGAALPRVGGDYVYLRYAYGPLVGFLSGWASLTIGFGAAIAAAAASFAVYFLRMLPLPEPTVLLPKIVAILLLWAVTAAHLTGVGTGGALQRVLTTTKVTAILLLILGGLLFGRGSWANLTVHAEVDPSPGAFMVALIFILYTYLGWNVVGYIAGEIAEPQRMIPRIVIGGTAAVAVLYLLLNLVYLYALPITALAEPPVLPVAEKSAAAMWGPASGRLMAGLLCVSIAGGVSAMVWAGPRVYWAMAEDGVFAPFFKTVSRATGVPVRAILLQSVWASILILTGTFEQLVVFSGFVLAAFSALTVGAVIVLRWRRPELPRPYRVPLYPLLPAAAAAVLLTVVGYSLIERPLECVLGIATVLAGVPFYFLWRSGRRT